MNQREKEYKEIFIAESLEIYDFLSRLIVELEKMPNDDKVLAEIFRLLHNLKANAKATGFNEIGDIAHKLETAFGLIRNKELSFTGSIVTILLDGIDLIDDLVKNVDNPSHGGAPEELLRNLGFIIENASVANIELQSVRKFYDTQTVSLSDLIYIRIKKLDDLLNLVGELIIDKDRIIALEKEIEHDELRSVVSHLHRVTAELQNSVMDARLINIGSLFNKFPRIVRDVAIAEGKHVEVDLSGMDIQIDRNILQILTDSLIHIVRNAISHGIETPQEREKKNKPSLGVLKISASIDKDSVLVQVSDDGAGIDLETVKRHAISQGFVSYERSNELNSTELLSFIFEPGFSLSKEVTDVSGRGVGLDVVKNAIDVIGGKIFIESQVDVGTTFNLNIPTSMAVKGALLFEVSRGCYAIPLVHTVFVSTVNKEDIHQVGQNMVYDIKSEIIPLIYLKEFFDSDSEKLGTLHSLTSDKQDIIIVSYNNRKIGLIVDKFLRQQDIVIKPLHEPVNNIDMFGGVTLLGTGQVCLVLDIPSITRNFLNKNSLVPA
ncbi:MAG TPA: chemotaxis protein CheW [Cytophagaceae bacterium]|jgi:two-component system chemotaxis sensor kinase CheA